MADGINDDWDFWRECLKTGKLPDQSEDAHVGFYRIQAAATKPDYPCAVFHEPGDENHLVALIGRKRIDEGTEEFWDFLGHGWLKCRAVEYDEYLKAFEGDQWSDGKPSKKAQQPTPDAPPDTSPEESKIGDNSGDKSPINGLKQDFEDRREQAEAILKDEIGDQETADKAAMIARALGDISKSAGTYHEIEKKPHLEAGRAVDDKWRPLKTEPQSLAQRVKQHMTSFLAKKREEEERKQREAEEEAAKAAAEAAEAQRKSEESADQGSFDEAMMAESERAEKERAAKEAQRKASEANKRKANAGRTGARVSVRKIKVGVITNIEKALVALKEHEEVVAVVQKIADRAAKSGVPFDGMKIETQDKVQ